MTVQVSTRFKELILGADSFKSIFDQGRILIYTGTQPTTADYPATGTLLGAVTLQGQPWTANGSDGGLVFGQYGALVGKPAEAQWKLVASAAGIAGWFRLVGPALDNGGYSFASPRIDGAISSSGSGDFYIADTTLALDQVLEVQQFNFSLPPMGG